MLRLLQEADMMAGDWRPEWEFTAARAKLRQAERHFAKCDSHDEPLKPLSPQVRKPQPRTRPKRRRYRCTGCFTEMLWDAEVVDRHPTHRRMVGERGNRVRVDCGDWELVERLPAGGAAK